MFWRRRCCLTPAERSCGLRCVVLVSCAGQRAAGSRTAPARPAPCFCGGRCACCNLANLPLPPAAASDADAMLRCACVAVCVLLLRSQHPGADAGAKALRHLPLALDGAAACVASCCALLLGAARCAPSAVSPVGAAHRSGTAGRASSLGRGAAPCGAAAQPSRQGAEPASSDTWHGCRALLRCWARVRHAGCAAASAHAGAVEGSVRAGTTRRCRQRSAAFVLRQGELFSCVVSEATRGSCGVGAGRRLRSAAVRCERQRHTLRHAAG
jgi:hypothetical protein